MNTLQQLIDERDIARILVRFAQVMDNRDWDAMGEVYAEDVRYDYGGGEQQGVDIILSMTRRHLDVCGGTQHFIGNISVDVDGDRAVSRSYVQARHQGRDDKAHLFFDTNGEYTDQWERRAAGWRIVRRDSKWFAMVGDPSVIGLDT